METKLDNNNIKHLPLVDTLNVNLDLSNIRAGMTVKNYKMMCQLLGEKVVGGASKQIQIEKWKTYISWKRDGHAFIIEKVYRHKQNYLLISVPKDNHKKALQLLKEHELL